MKNIIIETERLWLTEFQPGEEHLIYELNEDPAVTQYTGDPIRDLAHARQVLETVILPQYSLYGHGRWAVYIKDTNKFIGWCGLKTRPERDFEIDLGYRFLPAAWGKGYATEAAAATLRYGFEKLCLQRITGRAMPQNTGSLNVLEKIGMQYIGEEIVDDHPAKTYIAINPLSQTGSHS